MMNGSGRILCGIMGKFHNQIYHAAKSIIDKDLAISMGVPLDQV